MPSPDEHAAEAERLLKDAYDNVHDPEVSFQVLGERLTQIAQVHTQLALLASRPVDGTGLLDVQAQNIRELRGENDRLRAELTEAAEENERFRGTISELRTALEVLISELHSVPHSIVNGSLAEALNHAEGVTAVLAEPVPSTGEDQESSPTSGPITFWLGTYPAPEPSTGEDQSSTRGMSGAERIARERARQIEAEGWTPEHDDQHEPGQLVDAAACYALQHATYQDRPWMPDPEYGWQAPRLWPWAPSWWKPSDDPIRNLEKAGALVAAEIDRLQRLRGAS